MTTINFSQIVKTQTSRLGEQLYLAMITRPDISAAIYIFSRKNENPWENDWNAIKRVISYLKTTKHLKLTISKQKEPILTTCAVADWAGDKSDRNSNSENLCKPGDTSILWITKKQNSVALSSVEAEYFSSANASNCLVN